MTPGPLPASETPDEERAQPRLGHRARIVLMLLGLTLVVAVAIWFFRHQTYGRYFQETNDAQISADPVIVAPRVSGHVTEVAVIDNQDVKQGQLLARIDPRDYRAQAAQADAQIAQAAAAGDNIRAALEGQEATIARAEAELGAARARAAHDAAEVRRYAPLAASGAETRERLADLKLAAIQSAQTVAAQEAALVAERRRIASLGAQMKESAAQRDAASARLKAVNVDLAATELRAATAGRIGNKTVTVGQFVQAGTRLMSVVPLDRMYVVANFKETQLALIRPGQPATIRVDALDDIEIHGSVESISPGTGATFSLLPPENATGNFTKIVQRVPVRIRLEAPEQTRRLLVPGLSVVVTVDTRDARDELKRLKAAATAAPR